MRAVIANIARRVLEWAEPYELTGDEHLAHLRRVFDRSAYQATRLRRMRFERFCQRMTERRLVVSER